VVLKFSFPQKNWKELFTELEISEIIDPNPSHIKSNFLKILEENTQQQLEQGLIVLVGLPPSLWLWAIDGWS